MIPIRDDAPKYITPYVTYLLIGLNVLIFIFELLLPPDNRNIFIMQFGILPARLPAAFHVGGNVSLAGAFVPLLSSRYDPRNIHRPSDPWAARCPSHQAADAG